MADRLTLTAPSSPSNTWFKAIQTNVDLPHSFLAKFNIERSVLQPHWAFIISFGTEYYLIGVDGNRRPFIWKYENGTYRVLISLPVTTPVEGSVTISFRERRFRDEAKEVWHCFAMWINNEHVVSHLENVIAVLPDPIHFGFAAYTSQQVVYDEVTLPELSEYVDWISIDPGEPPLRALERSIEGQYVKYFIRFNGRLRAWLPKETASAYTYPRGNTFSSAIVYNLNDLKTHVRQLGAYAQAEFYRHDLIKKYGHKFAEVSNPYLMTEQECLRQAELTIKRMEEETDIEGFDTFYNPTLEIEDHITTDSGERIISQRSVRYQRPGANEQVTARRYTYGS